MSRSLFYLDGQFINGSQSLLDIFTPGAHQWHGVFETMRVCRGKIEFCNEHVERLIKGLKTLKIRHGYTKPRLKRILGQLVRRNAAVSLGRLRLMIFKEDGQIHCAAMVLKYKPFSVKQYKEGLKVCVIKTLRPATAKWAAVKSLDYALFAKAHAKALSDNYDDALLVNNEGHIFESTRANIFIVVDNVWITPPLSSGCLNGIVRQEVIKTAKQLHIPLFEKNISPACLKSAKHIYLTNSLVGMIRARRY